MQWMARGSNGGYFEMMGGGWLIRQGSLLPDPREPSLAPNPRLFASQHVQSSKSTQPSCQPGQHQTLSSNLSSCGAHRVATTPMYLFLVLSVYILLTHPVYCLCGPPSLSIHGSIYTSSSSYLSLLPSSPTKSNCAVDPFHSDCQL